MAQNGSKTCTGRQIEKQKRNHSKRIRYKQAIFHTKLIYIPRKQFMIL